MATHFPDVLVALGAPDLEDRFLPGARTHAVDGPQGRTLEVVLQRRPLAPLWKEPAIAAAQSPAFLPPHQQGIFDRLDQLAQDFEELSAALAAVAPAAPPPAAPPTSQRLEPTASDHSVQGCANIDVLADDFHALAGRLHIAQASPGIRHTQAEGQLGSDPVPQGPAALAFAPLPRISPASPVMAAYAGKGDTPVAPAHGTPAVANPRGAGTDPESAAKNLTPKSSRSSRGGQARQGALEGHAGRSRTLPAKVIAFRNQHQDHLSISIHKLQQLDSEPMSPKFVAGDSSKGNIWGKKRQARSASPHEDRSADAITVRIEKKLMQMFGEAQGSDKSIGLCKRYKSID